MLTLLFEAVATRGLNQVETHTQKMGALSSQIGGYLLILQVSLAEDFIVHSTPLELLT